MHRLCVILVAVSSLLVPAASASEPAMTSETPGNEITARDFHRVGFGRSTTIDNKWLPLKPGTQFVYEGATSEGKRRVPHRTVFTVTDLTKVVAGVRTVVVWDRDYSHGELVETELAFFAQDNGGNVWHLGQYPEEYEHGKFVGAPAWLHGIKGARAGIFVKAKPRLGAPSYSQGFAPPPINWTDRAKVHKLGQHTCVPAACYDGVLVTAEFNRDQPGKYQLKYYAPGVGNVRVGWLGAKDTDKEVLVLVKVRHLRPPAVAELAENALRLEKRAYRVSKDVYGRTSPARRRSSH